MMRDSRTLKGLFADPQPPCRKNFIKENVKSVRQMEKLFHSNDNNVKNFKFQVSKTIKMPNTHIFNKNHSTTRHSGLLDSNIDENDGELTKLFSKKLCLDNQNHRKRSTSGLTNKKTMVKKFVRPSIHGGVLRKSQHGYKEQAVNHKTDAKQKIKSQSIGDIVNQGSKEETHISENINCKSQGVQTVDTNDIESIYSEGIIRYPSGNAKKADSCQSDRGDMISEENDSPKQDSDHLTQHSSPTSKGSVSVASRLASQLSKTGAPPASYRVGVVPKYIKERKEAMQKEQSAKIAAKQSDCPKGHVSLPDSERKETLCILKKNYQEYVHELNGLPIRTDTLRSQRRKMEIEKQLAKLEDAIKVFSRPKVFVKVDA
ncbi:uncharacterized protein LOC106641194 [Copidosoma floridanum]|uniref:uncharacterized protein LOC106641194 n=1 Tax=Copidosoma floridanum TaxID=29053 RepID=UPI0006C98B99|nr:uncharacterized protein LOC106641194 [Copidosoma floridanum]